MSNQKIFKLLPSVGDPICDVFEYLRSSDGKCLFFGFDLTIRDR